MRKGRRKKVKRAKDEEANGQGRKKGGKEYPGPMQGQNINGQNKLQFLKFNCFLLTAVNALLVTVNSTPI